MAPPGSQPDWRKSLGEAGPLLGLGMQMALTMALFVGGGFWLDRELGTMPWFTLAGALAGIATLIYHLFRLIRDLNKKKRS